ncbi:MAG: hypothetical protein V1839_03000 [archaeon]
MKVFESRNPYPTKADLERVLTISEIFDCLNPVSQYTLHQIATDAKTRFNLSIKEMEDSLKKVNDIMHIFDRTVGPQKSDGLNFHYLYSYRMSSAETRKALEEYNSEHYKTPLKKLPYVIRSRHLEDF